MSLLEQLAREIEAAIFARAAGRIFQMSDKAIAIDFVPHAGSYLFIDYGRRPRAFLIVRKLKHIERESIHLSQFAIEIKRALSDLVVHRVAASGGVIAIGFGAGADELSLETDLRIGGAGLKVRSPNGEVVASSKPSRELNNPSGPVLLPDSHADGASLSQVLDEQYRSETAGRSFDRIAAEARRVVGREVAKARRLLANIEGDIVKHGDAETWKKFGDLILANLQTLRREGEFIVLTDYFDENVPEIRVPADENKAPSEIAEEYFRRYTRARNAADQAANRRALAERDIAELERKREKIEAAIERHDEEFLAGIARPRQAAPVPAAKQKRSKSQEITQARRFVSSTGAEILVGKKSVDNDYLTFRIAKSNDLWLHAADYPGSHVIVRNNSKDEVPQKVLHEAARLAAFYSDAREMPKAAVNYTPRKFVQKPKRAAPGMVSLSKFRTLLVEPGVPESVTKV